MFRGAWIAALGGVIFAASSPPTNLYPAVVLGLAVLAFAIDDAPTARRAFGRAMAWGTAAQIVGLRFVPEVIARFTPLPRVVGFVALALLAAAQSIPWAIGALVARLASRRLRAPIEASFAACVAIALSLPKVFAWSPAGLVTPWPAFVQFADAIGERGVSALFAVGAALLARAARRRTLREAWSPIALAVALFLALFVFGELRLNAAAARIASLPTVRVALVDQAVPPLERWRTKNYPRILAELRALTEDAEAQGAELTVWPEAAYPYALAHDEPRISAKPISILGRGVHGPVLFGLITLGDKETDDEGHVRRDSYNSATLLLPDGKLEPTQDKLELLAFGEAVPLGDELPFLRRIFERSGGLVPGKAPRALVLDRSDGPRLTMAVLNCYEDTLTGAGRRLANALAPNLLVNVTNDAWFFGTAESELHARLAALRAIELRRDLVRAVNEGVSTWVDAAGRTRARGEGDAAHVLVVTPAISSEPASTLYETLGDAPLAIVLFTVGLASFFRTRRAGVNPPANP